MKINSNYQNLNESYLFSTIAKRVNDYAKRNPSAEIIRLGIGDVTLPLAQCVVDAMKNACDEMTIKETFKGYGEEQGYLFLRNAVKNYYRRLDVNLDASEIFISDGAKSDIANILDIFDRDNIVLVPNPIYPVYLDTNLMLGRTPIFLDANKDNGFLPMPDFSQSADIIYLCSPNNPTGAVYSREQLKVWVDYAMTNNGIILFDSAYEAFVNDEDLPRSIYEIEDAEKCAIEFCSLSKTAGFTGVRCGYTVVPKQLGKLNAMWLRRQSTKFNGVGYIVQRGAESVFSERGLHEISENLKYYMNNAKLLSETLDQLGIWHTGGKNSPYIWLDCGIDSWAYFDMLLNEIQIVGTPGAGFGENGKTFFRLTAFNTYEKTKEACERMLKFFKSKN